MSRILTITNIGKLVKRRDCRTKEGGRNMREVSCAAVTQAVRDLCIQANTQLTGDVCQAIRAGQGTGALPGRGGDSGRPGGEFYLCGPTGPAHLPGHGNGGGLCGLGPGLPPDRRHPGGGGQRRCGPGLCGGEPAPFGGGRSSAAGQYQRQYPGRPLYAPDRGGPGDHHRGPQGLW